MRFSNFTIFRACPIRLLPLWPHPWIKSMWWTVYLIWPICPCHIDEKGQSMSRTSSCARWSNSFSGIPSTDFLSFFVVDGRVIAYLLPVMLFFETEVPSWPSAADPSLFIWLNFICSSQSATNSTSSTSFYSVSVSHGSLTRVNYPRKHYRTTGRSSRPVHLWKETGPDSSGARFVYAMSFLSVYIPSSIQLKVIYPVTAQTMASTAVVQTDRIRPKRICSNSPGPSLSLPCDPHLLT